MTERTTPPNQAGRPIDRLRQREHRLDTIDKVTGRTRYVADLPAVGALVGMVLTSPVPHARIRSIDTSAVQGIPGVRAVLTGADLRDRYFGRRLLDRPVLCWDRVRFVGDRIVAVAAETEAAARAAIAAISVDLEPLPALFDIDAAEAPDAPVLHEHPEAYRYLGGTRPPTPHPNVQARQLVEVGADELRTAFARAATVVAGEYRAPRTHAAHLEPHATLVVPQPDGRIVVHSTNKSPFLLREQLVAALGLDPELLVIDARAIGGDFGAKGYSIDEFVAVALARVAGRPVRMVTRLEEELSTTSVRHAAIVRLRTGLDADGRIVAHEADIRMDGGAYAGAKPIPSLVPGGATTGLIPYHVPALRIDARVLYTNTVPGGHVRAPGEPQTVFAGESHIDELARAAGMDPLAFRALNAVRPGETGGHGHGFIEARAVDVIGAVAADRETAARRGEGWGMAVTARHVGIGGSVTLDAAIRADGTILVTTGLVDQGGGVHTVIVRVLAAALAIEEERVHVRCVPTDGQRPDRGIGGSRTTHLASRAALSLAERIRAWVEERLPPPEPPAFDPATLGSLVRDRPVALSATYDSETSEGARGHYDFTACAVDLSVDRETGQVRIHDVLLVVDVGTVINPVSHRGQIIGGFVFGLGQAMSEEIVLEDGHVLTRNLDAYQLPRAVDVPPIRVIELPTLIGPGAFGAKMAGELANAIVGPAVANAIADATGVRLRELPLTAARISAARRAAE